MVQDFQTQNVLDISAQYYTLIDTFVKCDIIFLRWGDKALHEIGKLWLNSSAEPFFRR